MPPACDDPGAGTQPMRFSARVALGGCKPPYRFVRTRRRSPNAKVAELVDALALGASGVTRESSSLSFRTN